MGQADRLRPWRGHRVIVSLMFNGTNGERSVQCSKLSQPTRPAVVIRPTSAPILPKRPSEIMVFLLCASTMYIMAMLPSFL